MSADTVFDSTVASFNATPLMTTSVNGRRVSNFASGTPGSALFFWQGAPASRVFVVRTQAPYWVTRVQEMFHVTPVDGRYGPLTEQAIRSQAARETPPASVNTPEALLSYALSKAFFGGQGIVGLPSSRVMPNPSNPVRAAGSSAYVAVYDIALGAAVNIGSDGLPIGANTPAPQVNSPVPAPTPVPVTPATNVVDTVTTPPAAPTSTPGTVQESYSGPGSPIPTSTGGTNANNALNRPDGQAPTGVFLESAPDRAVLSAGTGVPAPANSGRVFIRLTTPPTATGVTFTAPTSRSPTVILSSNVRDGALTVLGDTPAGMMPFDFAFAVNGVSRTSSLNVTVEAGRQTNVSAIVNPDGAVTLASPTTMSAIGEAVAQPQPQPIVTIAKSNKALYVVGGLLAVSVVAAIALNSGKD